ncbi:hypothetical protein PsorP6_017818 [Peronosclerospora sorghi]|uniref:Uncharacterized protein n=1 Tax=Peronosclerospora sorghi TaxID=230839 RepID=A0ACC0WC59_9STRA|nr:hypothetical protein PsorP6_017818 [Peronosclerospora sorghi]
MTFFEVFEASGGHNQDLSTREVYSSVATDAEYVDRFTSDDESLYDVGTEGENRTVHTPEYGSLTPSSQGIKDRRHNEPTPQRLALVIDGQAIEFAIRPQLRRLFYQVTQKCASSVICCRASPKQKADIVEFVRELESEIVTLAIGDGANDGAMIHKAHGGVGICGQEGAQDVNASDYALSLFRFLQRLLFVQGRWAYRRVAKIMSYMLYKSVTLIRDGLWKIVRRLSLPAMYHILQEREVMGLPNPPRSMHREYCRSASERDPVGNYRLLRSEIPEEYFMRSSPLGERLIGVPGSQPPIGDGTSDSNSNFQVQQKKHNLRIRGSLHASGRNGNFSSG